MGSKFNSVWDNPGPDKGWSWVIAFGLWITGFPAYGIFGTLGVIYPVVQETLQISQEEASWPFFLSSVTGNLVGIILPVVTRIMTIRQLLTSSLALFVFGGIVCFVSPKSILILSVFFGIPYGIFHGFFMHSSFVVVAQYFDKFRASALAIFLTAPAIAMFTLPLMIQHLLNVYEYRGALLLVAAFAAQSFPAIFLLRPRDDKQFQLNTPPKTNGSNNIAIKKVQLANADKEITPMLHENNQNIEINRKQNGKYEVEFVNENTKMIMDNEKQSMDVDPKVLSKKSRRKLPQIVPINADTRKGGLKRSNVENWETKNSPVKLSSLRNDLIKTMKRPEWVLVVVPDASIMTSYIFNYILMVAHADLYGISQNVVALGYLSFGISALILRLSFAFLIDRKFVRKDILILLSFLSALGNSLLYIFWNTPETYVACAVLFSFSISSYQSLRLSHMTNHFLPRDIPILLSFSSIFSSSISLVTPKLIGLSIAFTGTYKPLWILSSVLLATSILALIVDCFCVKRKSTQSPQSS